jgi:hypothetical protein
MQPERRPLGGGGHGRRAGNKICGARALLAAAPQVRGEEAARAMAACEADGGALHGVGEVHPAGPLQHVPAGRTIGGATLLDD